MLPKEEKGGESKNSKPRFNWEELLQKHKVPIALSLFGIILVGLGVFYSIRPQTTSNIEIIEADQAQKDREVVVEVSGEVSNPGVYSLAFGSRV